MLRIEEISEAVKSPKIQVKHKNVYKKTDETHAPMDTDIQNSYPRGEAERGFIYVLIPCKIFYSVILLHRYDVAKRSNLKLNAFTASI